MGEKDLRSIWDDQEDEASQLDSPTADSPLFDSLSSPSGAATLENITAAKPERDRGWERRNPTASYRGVPQKLGPRSPRNSSDARGDPQRSHPGLAGNMP